VKGVAKTQQTFKPLRKVIKKYQTQLNVNHNIVWPNIFNCKLLIKLLLSTDCRPKLNSFPMIIQLKRNCSKKTGELKGLLNDP